MGEYWIDIIFTNSYSQPPPETIDRERRDSPEEEKSDPEINPGLQSQGVKYIDSKETMSKHTEKEMLDIVLNRAQDSEDCASESNTLIQKFQSLAIIENVLKAKTPSPQLSIGSCLDSFRSEGYAKKKRKYARLTDSEKLFIVKEVKLKKRNKKELSKTLEISYSTIRRVVREMWSEGSKTSKWFDSAVYTKKITKRTQDEIKYFIYGSRSWVTASQIADYIKKNTNQEIPQSTIRRYLKEDLSFSYRKGTPKPWSVNLGKLRAVRIWYSTELIRNIDQPTLLVNIDETCLSKTAFNNRSWFPKGNSGEVFSIGFRNSISLILAITSEGDYFGATIRRTVDSKIYKQFLENLEEWLQIRDKKRHRNIILIHDNAPIHRSKILFEFTRDDGYIHAFLPPYTPEYAPVELIFGQIKSHIKKSCRKSLIDLRGNEGIELVKSELSRLDRKVIIKCWRHSLERMKQDLARFIHNIELISPGQNCS